MISYLLSGNHQRHIQWGALLVAGQRILQSLAVW